MTSPRIASPRKRRYPVIERPISLALIVAVAFGLGLLVGLLWPRPVASAPSSAVHVVSGSTLGQSSPAPTPAPSLPVTSAPPSAAVRVGIAAATPTAPTNVHAGKPRRIAPSVPHRVGGAARTGGHLLRGGATWYDAASGAAAAGPALRAALGPHWRNHAVRVCAGTVCVHEVLSDWCQCSATRIIDLPHWDFARLASPSRGVIAVTVSW